MQQPDGTLNTISDLFGDRLRELKVQDQLIALRQKSEKLEKATGKPHPVFVQGEELEIRGGRFKVDKIERDFLILKPVKY